MHFSPSKLTPANPNRLERKLAISPSALVLVVLLWQFGSQPTATAQTSKNTDKDKISNAQKLRLQSQRALAPEAFNRLPDKKIPRVVLRLYYPDLQRQRAAYWALAQRDERGQIPFGARLRAIESLETLRKNVKQDKTAGLPSGTQVKPKNLVPLTAGADPKLWKALGPGNIGGRIRSLVVHPTTHNRMWAGSIAGGIWRTDDGGKEFYPVDDFMINLAITGLAIDPTNDKVMYATTGEGFGNVDGLRGAGIFRSEDGGNKWSQLKGTDKVAFQWTNRLAISSDGKVLFAATRGDGGPGDTGIWTSEDTKHETWTLRLGQPVGSLVCHPGDPKKAIAGGLRDGKAYYTEDGGLTWKNAVADSDWSGRVELTYAAKDPSIVYASIDVNNGELWRSADGGKTYGLRSTGKSYLGNQGWYDNTVWAGDPGDSDLVLVGGIDLWRSTDGGLTLKDISTWWADDQKSAHADHHAIVAHPNFASNKTVFFCNDGGVYWTEDIRTVGNDADLPRLNGWKELNNALGITQFYGAAGNVKSGVIIGGTQDNGTLRLDKLGGPESWTTMFGGDGGYCAADQTDENYFYGEYVYLNIHRSTDAGKTSEFISGQYWNGFDWVWKPVPYRIPDARSQQANFIAPFVLDPNESKRILAGGASLWRTNDAKAANTDESGPEWASVKDSVGSFISAIAVAPGNSDIIYVGHNNGDVYRTKNGTKTSPTWVKVDSNGPNPLPDRVCTRIVIDPADHKSVYVTYGGYSKANVWKTSDEGGKWQSISSGLPEAPVRALAIHPENVKWLYIGTTVGIFASEDGGTTWSPTNEGPTNCSVDELFWMGADLIAATHGRGLFRCTPK